MTDNCYGYSFQLEKPSNVLALALMFHHPNPARSVVCVFEGFNADGEKIQGKIRGAYHSKLLNSIYVYAPETENSGPAKVAVLRSDEAIASFDVRLLNWPDRSPVDTAAFGPLLISTFDQTDGADEVLGRKTRILSVMGGIL